MIVDQLIQIVAIGVSIACGVAIFLYFTVKIRALKQSNLIATQPPDAPEPIVPVVVYVPASFFKQISSTQNPQPTEEPKIHPESEPTRQPTRQRLIRRVGDEKKR